jgi:hypothetical protein
MLASSVPDMEVVRDEFEIAGWTPNGETLHDAVDFKIGSELVGTIGVIPYSLPTNGTYAIGE